MNRSYLLKAYFSLTYERPLLASEPQLKPFLIDSLVEEGLVVEYIVEDPHALPENWPRHHTRYSRRGKINVISIPYLFWNSLLVSITLKHVTEIQSRVSAIYVASIISLLSHGISISFPANLYIGPKIISYYICIITCLISACWDCSVVCWADTRFMSSE